MTKPLWLVAYDFSEGATAVVEKSLEELSALKGALLLLHVIHAPPVPTAFGSVGSEAVFATAGEFSQALLDNAEQHLAEFKRTLDKRFSGVTIEIVVREGDAVEEIVGVATERHVDRIIVGTHGRRGMGRVLMGSIAERVVRLSPVSVLVIKTPQP